MTDDVADHCRGRHGGMEAMHGGDMPMARQQCQDAGMGMEGGMMGGGMVEGMGGAATIGMVEGMGGAATIGMGEGMGGSGTGGVGGGMEGGRA